RIPPAGFVPGPTTAIIGADYGDAKSGVRAYDEGTFHLTVPADTKGSALTVRAEGMYQSTVSEMIDALAAADTTDAGGKTLQQLYAATGYAAPSGIASAEASVTLAAGAPDGGASAGGGGSGGSGGGGEEPGGKDGGCGCAVKAEGAGYAPALLAAA